MAGFDGFIDNIIGTWYFACVCSLISCDSDVVEKRASPSEYTTFPGIDSLGVCVLTSNVCCVILYQSGKFISASAGESCNIELVVKKSKIGGNGPIMCNASCGYVCGHMDITPALNKDAGV